MLDFMREQESENSSSQQQKDGVDNSSGQENHKAQSYITATDVKKNSRKSTILLAVLFVIGLICLVFMIKKTTPKAASAAVNAEVAQMEKIIASMGGTKNQASNDIDEVVKQFSEFSNVKQVQSWDLIKNPFKHEIFLGDVFDNGELNFDSSKQDGLELFSIMKSSEGNSDWCCMIDDKLLYEGDSIKGFKVVQITSNTVKLESEGTETILKLTE